MSSSRETVAKNTLTIARDTGNSFPAHQQLCRRFLQTFESSDCTDSKFGKLKYKAALRQVVNRHVETVWIDLEELEAWCRQQSAEPDEAVAMALGVPKVQLQSAAEDLVPCIERGALRYLRYFTEACLLELPERDEEASTKKTNSAKDTIDIWRRRLEEQAREDGGDKKSKVPEGLRHSFDVRFKPRSKIATSVLREVKSDDVGALVQLQATVVRTEQVKPRIQIATYHCETCDCEVFQEVQADNYTPLIECLSKRCQENKTKGKLSAKIRTSKYVRYQEIRVQEMASDVPIGGVPRSMNVVCYSDLTRQALPGESVLISGVFRPVELPGFAARAKGTTQEMYLEAHYIQKLKRGYNEDMSEGEKRANEQLEQDLQQDPDIYERAAKSIAPEIYGLLDVKKALLLLLVGGTTKTMADGMKIRGDIHTLIMGDPGVAKSQLLKQVVGIAPRSVFTTGKGSSGVGLTASVIRDKNTGEVTLEGGALVLADMGVCCIDEFDKMEESDRTAIHEVMEQQTVSIAKAGITTTLNSRTTVLAAANPAYGRYNPAKSPVENMAMPAALLSRFDLQFLLLDRVDRESDMKLALHVTQVHRASEEKGPEKGDAKMVADADAVLQSDFKPLSHQVMRMYIRKARDIDPVITDDLKADIADTYVQMRQEQNDASYDSRKSYTTPRQLLALIRMSMAVARTRFSSLVERQDFEEAMRLHRASKESVEFSKASSWKSNPLDIIYDIVADLSQRAESKDEWVEVSLVVSMAGHPSPGCAAIDSVGVEEALANWESLSVMTRNEAKTLVKFSRVE